MIRDHDREPMSREVLARKQVILARLVSIQREDERRSRSRRALASAAALCLIVVCAWLLVHPNVSVSELAKPDRASITIEAGRPALRIEVVQSAVRPLHVEMLNDNQLLRELNALGIPAGIARYDDRVMVVTR